MALISSSAYSKQQIFKNLEQAAQTMRKYLETNEFSKVRAEYVYYIVTQSIQEDRIATLTSFFQVIFF